MSFSQRWRVVVAAIIGALTTAACSKPQARLLDVGPRLVSNQTSQPLAWVGDGFTAGMEIELGPPLGLRLPLRVIDAHHAYSRLPPVAIDPATTQVTVPAQLRGASGSGVLLTIVNDAAMDDPTRLVLSPDGQRAFIASPRTDSVFVVELGGAPSRRVRRLRVGDGPAALAAYRDSDGTAWLAVAYAFSPSMSLFRLDAAFLEALDTSQQPFSRSISAPPYATGLLLSSDGATAFVAEHQTDSVLGVRLSDGKTLWQTPVDPNPRELVWAQYQGAPALAVGSLQSGEVQVLSPGGQLLSTVVPRAGQTEIIGGHTSAYSKYIMGGKAPRALIFSPALDRLFIASIGPNIGPNPDRMEVSMNGGLSVAALAAGRVERHLGFNAGVPEGMALDDARGILYSTDAALGLVRVLDARALAQSPQAKGALLQELAIQPPDGFPLFRPAADFGAHGRAGVELHSGPRSLALSADQRTLYVLNRTTLTLAVVDVTDARSGQAQVKQQISLADPLVQRRRRLGEVLYFADLGKSAMSCDACHLEGHSEGVLFEKTHPMRIYRSPTIRAARETPPYFIPASTHSIAQTIHDVGNRNRYHNPEETSFEVDALTEYSATVTLLPNPYRQPDGLPVETVTLPSGRQGHPSAGMRLFEGKANCAGCHPAPHFTTDQDAATRGRSMDVGTPKGLPLRLEQQEATLSSFPPPSLLGAWDIWPMLTSGAAGFRVKGVGLEVSSRFPLESVVLDYPAHGNARALSESERDDLFAYLLSL